MKALILANGQLSHPDQVRSLAREADLLLAADGGTRHARTLGLRPHLVVGDLDSLSDSDLQALRASGTTLLQYPAAKDETDLELALVQAVQRGADDILVCTALGGRTDQTLANVLLLALQELVGRRCAIVEGPEAVFLIRGEVEVAGEPGDVFSLIPIGGDCHDIWTEGLEYPLAGGSLYLARARGISNVLIAPRARVRVGRGTLLAVHRAQRVRTAWPTFTVWV
ncbi:MAG: thiamine diphosphokinase [Anaerolineae bacterium]|nr:thiamine diphosphokinase [Anaerolineae bacterium]